MQRLSLLIALGSTMLVASCGSSDPAPDASGSAPSASAKAKVKGSASHAAAGSAAPASSAAPAVDEVTLATPFEGEIDMTMRMPGLPGTMKATYAVKAGKSRFDADMTGMPKMWVLVDVAQDKSWAVLDAQKMMLVTDMTKPVGGAKMVEWKATKMGKTEVVAGQHCEMWGLVGEKNLAKGQPAQRYELCVVHKATTFGWIKLANARNNTYMAWAPELEKEGSVPLRTVGFDETGKESVRVEATRFERKPIDDARFTLPTGYRTMDAPAL